MAISLTYKGSEALEMLKTHFPTTWENEINKGRSSLKILMKLYNISAFDAYQKYLKLGVSGEDAIATLASLHVMNEQFKIGTEILELKKQQQQYVNQSVALESSDITSFEDKKIIRQHYYEKRIELQSKIENLINNYPVVGAEVVKIKLNIFDN